MLVPVSKKASTKADPARSNIFQEIAKLSNVSAASVTFALQDSSRISEETKYRVYRTARELGYRRSKVRGNKHLQFAIFHAKILPIQSMAGGSTQFDIWYGVTQAVNRLEATLNIYELSLLDGNWEFSKLPSQFKRDQFDGIIVTGVPGKAFLDFMEEIQMPVVVASNTDLSSNVDQVCFDYERAARIATGEAIARGKRRIGFVSTGSKQLVNQALFHGYTRAMQEADCFDEKLISVTGELYDHEGVIADTLLKRCPDLEMLFATTPRTAHQAALAAALHGIPAPDGIEFIALQSEEHRELRYRTHVILPNYGELGQSAMNRLLERREKPSLPSCSILLQCGFFPDPTAK